jgi:hypothetical protein
MKYLGINLKKDVNYVYKIELQNSLSRVQKVENYLMLMVGRINIAQMALLPKAIYMFSATPIKIPMSFITEMEKSIVKLFGSTKDGK